MPGTARATASRCATSRPASRRSLDSGDKASYERPTWTEKGDGLAALKGVETKGYADKLYSVVGFTGFPGAPAETVFDPAKANGFPEGMTVSPNRDPRWTEDLSALLFGIHEAKKKPAGEEGRGQGRRRRRTRRTPTTDDEVPDLVLWSWRDPRLQSEQQVQAPRDREYSYLSEYRVADHAFLRLADDELRDVTPAPHDRWAVGKDNRAYELDGNLDGRKHTDVYAVDMRTGARRLLLKRSRWSYGVSPDGESILYYDDGQFYACALATGASRNVTAGVPASFVDTENDHNVVKPPVRPVGWAADSRWVLLSDNYDVWKVPAGEGAAVNLTVNGRKDAIRYRRRFALDPDEKGIDLSRPQYFEAYGEWTKQDGLVRLAPGAAAPERLTWGDALLLAPDEGGASRRVRLHARDLRPLAGRPRDGRDLQARHAGQRHQPAAEGLPLVERLAAGGLQERQGGPAAGGALPAGELRAGQGLPDDRVHLREAVEPAERVRPAERERVRQVGVHEQRLRGADARHHLPRERPGHVGRVVRPAGAQGGHRHRHRGSRRAWGCRATRGAATRRRSSSPRRRCSPPRSPARRSPTWSACTA